MSIDLFRDYSLSWEPDSNKLTRPYFKSIVKMMKSDVDEGILLPGTKLPPQRELSYFLGVSFHTITRAYQLSQKMGLTYGVVGRGTYIDQSVNNQLTIAKDIDQDIAELGFVSSFESSSRFLKSTISAAANQRDVLKLLKYDSQTGLANHKMIATKYLKRIGMHVNQPNTLIVSGGQNALAITLAGLFHSGDKIAVNQFTYSNFIELARLNSIQLVPIESDEHGMRADLLAKAVQNNHVSGVYLMPDGANPTNEEIDLKRRHELSRVIIDDNLILIEDDYLNFLNLYKNEPLPKLSNLVPNQSVYICSMSKSIAAGLRVAFMRVSNQYLSEILDAIISINFKTSALDVDVITRSLENGAADKVMNDKVAKINDANQIFDQIFPKEADVSEPLWLIRQLPIKDGRSGASIESLFTKYQIRVFHSDRFAVGAVNQQPFLRISICSIDDMDELKAVLQKIRAILTAHNLY